MDVPSSLVRVFSSKEVSLREKVDCFKNCANFTVRKAVRFICEVLLFCGFVEGFVPAGHPCTS